MIEAPSLGSTFLVQMRRIFGRRAISTFEAEIRGPFRPPQGSSELLLMVEARLDLPAVLHMDRPEQAWIKGLDKELSIPYDYLDFLFGTLDA